MPLTTIPGEKKGAITLYALSTCIWCRKTKELLDKMGVEYQYVEVDLLEGTERAKVTDEVKALNPRCSFPTLAINNQCIVGFHEDKIQEALRA